MQCANKIECEFESKFVDVSVTGSNFEITFVNNTSSSTTCFFRYKSSGGKIRGSSRGHGVLPFHVGRTSFQLAVTSSNWFLPVAAHVK